MDKKLVVWRDDCLVYKLADLKAELRDVGWVELLGATWAVELAALKVVNSVDTMVVMMV